MCFLTQKCLHRHLNDCYWVFPTTKFGAEVFYSSKICHGFDDSLTTQPMTVDSSLHLYSGLIHLGFHFMVYCMFITNGYFV